jgi:hypothetical protein
LGQRSLFFNNLANISLQDCAWVNRAAAVKWAAAIAITVLVLALI